MQYGQVILFVVFCFAIYYIVMIVMDLQKANAAKLAEAENNKEEDIDISDEAKQFCPVKITREIKPKQAEAQTEEKTDGKQQVQQETSKDNGKNAKDNSQKNNRQPKSDVQNSNSQQSSNAQSPTNVQPQVDAEKQNIDQKQANNLSQEKTEHKSVNDPKRDEMPSQDAVQRPQRKLRKAIMTDGIEVEKLAELADAGLLEEKIGPIVRGCENAMTNIE